MNGNPETLVPALEIKSCKVCGEDIKKEARKCTHCDSYQDWRANVGFSNTVLSLLVALCSVLTVAVPVILDTVTPKNSDLRFAYHGISDHSITVLVTNK